MENNIIDVWLCLCRPCTLLLWIHQNLLTILVRRHCHQLLSWSGLLQETWELIIRLFPSHAVFLHATDRNAARYLENYQWHMHNWVFQTKLLSGSNRCTLTFMPSIQSSNIKSRERILTHSGSTVSYYLNPHSLCKTWPFGNKSLTLKILKLTEWA